MKLAKESYRKLSGRDVSFVDMTAGEWLMYKIVNGRDAMLDVWKVSPRSMVVLWGIDL